MKLLKILIILMAVHPLALTLAQDESNQSGNNPSIIGTIKKAMTPLVPPRDAILAQLIKNGLENYHFSQMKVDDDVSVKSFKLFIERMDYSKRFYLQSDVDQLQKFEKDIDDQLAKGNLEILKDATRIYRQRVSEAEAMSKEILAKPFDFSKDESFEVDAEKRKFPKTVEEKKEIWRKVLKLDALNRYLTMIDEQNGTAKDKDGKKKKKEKPVVKKNMTDAEMLEEARKKTADSYKRIFERIYKEDRNDDLGKIFNAVSMVFDPHTNYLPPREKEDFDIDISGSLEGIGALLQEDGEHIKVVEIIPGSASWRQKQLKEEDVILKVGQAEGDPVDITGMAVRDAVRLIRGKKGTEVRLTIKKPDGRIVVIPITRDTVEIEETYAKSAVLEHKKSGVKLGYISLPKFYRDFSKPIFDPTARSCANDVKNELIKLKAAGVDGVVIDLRNNGGGSLDDAVQMSGLFIKDGPVVQVKDSEGTVKMLKDQDSSIVYDGPVIVAVNKFSASASEILAGALQDYNRAVIVGGEHTHGKGTVQSIIDLDRAVSFSLSNLAPLGSLKMTISKFYRVNGGSTQYKGITPDIILPDPYDYLKTGERSLTYSLPWDEIQKASYQKWEGKLGIEELSNNSKKRVAQNPQFKKMNDTIDVLTKRRDETVVTLNAAKRKEEDKVQQALVDQLEMKDENADVVVSFGHETKAENNKVKKDEILKEKRDDFIKKLRQDPYIEEFLNIMTEVKSSQKSVAKK